jgi:iron complex outermembrane receptor protein
MGDIKLNRGKRDNRDELLYQQRPLHTALSLQHQHGKFQTQLKWLWQDRKNRVDSLRLENRTASYTLLDLSNQWQNEKLTLSVSITNLLDKDYELPLGGVNVAEYRQDNNNGFNQLKGTGRSINAAMRYNF